eukprot:TRINITY_DN5687_c0_g1_i1.p1 TRINITY_DN5687_c0_g1~~TRINITY_DN5687_c0_g1_i1.p1  ORF type:complete len:341 (+),score=62.04 TRINITY_DN5687_c0_g1_i1:61-1023(+)
MKCMNFPTRGFRHLTTVPSLRRIILANTSYTTDTALKHVSKCTSLASLELVECKKVTSQGVKHLRTLSQLRCLAMKECEKITDCGVAAIAELTSLHGLDLRGLKKITDEGMRLICTNLTNLISFYISGCDEVSKEGFSHISKLKNLYCLTIRGSRIHHDALQSLSGLTNLEYLDLTPAVPRVFPMNLDLSPLSNLTSLSVLKIAAGLSVHYNGMEWIKKLTNLCYLQLVNCPLITDLCLENFVELKELRALHIPLFGDMAMFSQLTADSLKIIKQLKKLEDLGICGHKNITTADLEILSCFPYLKIHVEEETQCKAFLII